MAFITEQDGPISQVAVELLVRSLALPMTATRVPGSEFSGPNGATISLRVRVPRVAQIQATPGAAITPTDISEARVDVTLAHLYDATNLTDEELTLEIEDFASQVTEPQVASIAVGAEDQMAAVMNALTPTVSFPLLDTAVEETKAAILEARATLGRNNVPMSGRFFAVSPEIATKVLTVPEFVRVDASGSDNALRNAVIGRVYGFTFVESPALDAGEAVAYHRSGFAFATRPPVNPRGAVSSSTANRDGIGMRQIFQYQPSNLQDQSVVSTFAGAAAVLDEGATPGTADTELRFVKLDTAIA